MRVSFGDDHPISTEITLRNYSDKWVYCVEKCHLFNNFNGLLFNYPRDKYYICGDGKHLL